MPADLTHSAGDSLMYWMQAAHHQNVEELLALAVVHATDLPEISRRLTGAAIVQV
jgi:hypothetical protein